MNADKAVQTALRLKPCTPKATARGKLVRCPCPEHEDVHPSCEIFEGEDHEFRATCYTGCDWQVVKDALREAAGEPAFGERSNGNGASRNGQPKHRSKAEVIAQYVYENEEAQPLFRVNRTSDKKFFQERWTGSEWVKSLGDTRRVPFRLPELQEAIAEDRIVWILEGEKDVLQAVSKGLTATCTPGSKWRQEFAEYFQDARVVIVPDNDVPGQKLALQIAEGLREVARDVRVLEPLGHRKGFDLSDFLDAGGTVAELWERYDSTPPWQPPADGQGKGEDVPPHQDALSELLAARTLQERDGEDILHSDAVGWLVRTPERWEPNQKAVEAKTHQLGQHFRNMTPKAIDGKHANKLHTYSRQLERSKTVQDVLRLARAMDGINANEIQFDGNPWLLNCVNGTYDFQACGLREHRRDDYITKLAPTAYKANAQCPRYLEFLQQVFEGDEELISYLQWIAGYCLTGDTSAQVFFVFHGAGANGKSTLLNVWKHVLGLDYATAINPELLMARRQGNYAADLAALRGIRLALAQETGDGRRLDEAFVKHLTGGDPVSARHLYQSPFTYTPELKLIIGTNHKPRVTDDSSGFWRRVRLIPFERQFMGQDADPNLVDVLRAEAEGVLAWMVEGALRHGVKGEPEPPERVKVASKEYKDASDLLGQFLEEECVLGDGYEVIKDALFERFEQFAGKGRIGKPTFGAKLKDRGFLDRKSGSRRFWIGISLTDK